jgi:pilin isopeptide linkage protein
MMKKTRTKGRWGRFLCTAILSAAIGLMSGAVPAFAITHIQTDKKDCSIELDLKYKDADSVEHRMADGKISIYQVATVKVENGYVFDLTGGVFADVTDAQVQSIPTMDKAQLDAANPELSKTLDAAVKASGKKELATVDVANGTAKFTGLMPGLYLIEQTVKSSDHAEFNPFLMSIPDAGNSYDVKAAPKSTIYAACKEDPPIKKIVEGTTGENDQFTFRMTADDPSFPMPEGSVDGVKTVTVTGPGEYEFGWMYFDHAGTYTYTVEEVAGTNTNYTYDTTPFKKTTVVEEVDGHLVVTKAVYSRNGADSEVATFTNVYSTGTTPTGGGGNGPGGGGRRSRPETSNPPTTPGEVLGATRDAAEDTGRGVLGAVRNPQVLGAVRTGDTSAMVTWAVILMLAASGIVGWFNVYRRKKSIQSL